MFGGLDLMPSYAHDNDLIHVCRENKERMKEIERKKQ